VRWALAGALCLLLPVLAAAAPQRIVSLNLCADQLVLALVAPERIASLTWLSRSEGDPALLALARRLPVNHGGAEEVLAARPDLVIAGLYTTSTTRRLLRRAGIPLLELEPVQDWDGIRGVTRRVAAALGEPVRGEALLADMDARLAALARARPETPIRVIGWGGGGNDVPGRDTLFNALLESAGGINVGVQGGERGGFDVERVVRRHPQALLRGVAYGDTPALRSEAARHRLLRRLYPQGQLTYPEALFSCGVPRAAAAAQALQRSLRDVAGSAARR
jgi:iron complex transport system substrate-binding protein